jgi:hypothetical protein
MREAGRAHLLGILAEHYKWAHEVRGCYKNTSTSRSKRAKPMRLKSFARRAKPNKDRRCDWIREHQRRCFCGADTRDVQVPFPFLPFPSRALERWSQGHALACGAARGQCEEETSPTLPRLSVSRSHLSASRFSGCLTAPSSSFHAAPQPMLLQHPHIPVEQQHGLEYLSSRGHTGSDVLAVWKLHYFDSTGHASFNASRN